jgi:hypothetical protein
MSGRLPEQSQLGGELRETVDPDAGLADLGPASTVATPWQRRRTQAETDAHVELRARETLPGARRTAG